MASKYIKDRVVDIEGLREFRRDLKAMGKAYEKGLNDELKNVAAPIAREAKRRYRMLHAVSRRKRGSQRGIRASASGGRAKVVIGSVRYPYLLGQEWGSRKWPQFPPATQSKPPDQRGYFFWPSVVAGRKKLMEDVEKLVDKANEKYFEKGTMT